MSAAAMPTPGQVQEFTARVDAVSACMHKLMLLLARERDALQARSEASVLEQVAGEKHAAVEQAGSLYAMLREAMAAIYGARQPVGDAVPALREADPALAARIETLVDLTRACKQANQDNGVLVSAGLRSAQRALLTLRGAQPGHAADGTYGPAGQSDAHRQGNRLAITA
jgi:flagellar biosynthesis/type III secretory pathway chaperone